MRYRFWTEAEAEVLRRVYPTHDRAAQIAALPDRTWNAIQMHAYELGVGRPTPRGALTDQKDVVAAMLRDAAAHPHSGGMAQMARDLGVTYNAVRVQAKRLGVAIHTARSAWSEADLTILRQMYPTHDLDAIQARLSVPRTFVAINARVRLMRLRKAPNPTAEETEIL